MNTKTENEALMPAAMDEPAISTQTILPQQGQRDTAFEKQLAVVVAIAVVATWGAAIFAMYRIFA